MLLFTFLFDRFINNVKVYGTNGSILLENPVGSESSAYQTILDRLHLGQL